MEFSHFTLKKETNNEKNNHGITDTGKTLQNTELCAQHFSLEKLYSTKNEASLQECCEKNSSQPEGLEAQDI